MKKLLLAPFAVLVFFALASIPYFSNNSPAVFLGNFSATNSATIKFTLEADTGFHKNRSVTLVEWGSIKCYIQYPEIRLGNISKSLDGVVGYPTITTGAHKWTIRFGNGLAEVLIDSAIILSSPYTLQPINSGLYMSSNSSIDKLSGTVTDFSFSPTYTKVAGEYIPDPVYDWRNLPKAGLNCYDQLLAYPAPKYAPGTYPRIHPQFDYYKAAGEDWKNVWGITADSCARAGVNIAKILHDKFNCVVRIGNIEDYISYMNQPNSEHGRFNNMLIDMINSNGISEIEVGISLSQLDDRGGYRAITTAETEAMLPNMPINRLQDEAEIIYQSLNILQAKLNKPIKYINFDNEYMPADKFLDTVKYQSIPSVKAAKEASGLSWRDYCSKQYTYVMSVVYSGAKRACPTAQIIEYDVNALDGCQYYYDAKFSYRIANNTNGMGTEQVYPRGMYYSVNGAGDRRGVLNSWLLNKRGQVNSGYKLSTPFVGVGYLGDYTKDMNPTSTIGMETLLTGAGCPYLYPALFVQGGNNPDPATYAYQMVSASYAQAALSKVWDIIIYGELLPGDRNAAWLCFGGTSYSFWLGDYESIGVVKKLGTRYAITAWRSAVSNVKPNVPYKRDGGIWLEGKYIKLSSRWQGSTYEYDSNKPVSSDNPRMLNPWVKFGDPNNWE